jgi:hypothetical protein
MYLTHKSLLLFIWILIWPYSLQAQNEEILVVGTMTDKQGEAIPGLSVFIEGSTKGTVTDINGHYSIKAPLGSTLVFSFIGMKTQRAKVTRTGLNPKGTRKIIPYNKLSDDCRFKKEQAIQAKKDSIKYDKRIKMYRRYLADSAILSTYDRQHVEAVEMNSGRAKRKVRRYTDPYGNRNFLMGNVVIESDVSMLTTGRLPNLQSTYSQGRPLGGQLLYRGPETGEYYSWGPPVRNLEFDGIPTSNDSNGSLVFKGMGNGKAANNYDPTIFFRTGFARSIGIASYQTIFGMKTNLFYQNQKGEGVIPNEENTQHTLRFKLNWNERLKVSLNYSNNKQGYKNGLMQSRILAAVYQIPISFDNAFGLSSNEALKQASSIYHPDGTVRSASPGRLDNPYYMVRETGDSRKVNAFQYKLNYKTNWNKGSLNANVSGEMYRDDRYLALPDLVAGNSLNRSSERLEELDNYFVGANLSNQLFNYQLQLKVPVRYEFYNYSRSLSLDYSDQIQVNKSRQLLMANPHLQFKHDQDIFLIKSGLNLYSSSTSNKTYLRPNVGIYFNPFQFLDDAFIWSTSEVFQTFKLSYNYHTQMNEYSFQTPVGLSNSLFYNVSEFNSYFEEREVGVSKGIMPELVSKHNLSLNTSFLYGRLSSETTVYWSKRENSIFPIVEGDALMFKNIGDIKTKGWEQVIEARLFQSGFRWNASLLISQTKPELEKLYDNEVVAVAGFKDVHTALMEGEVPGVIRGSSYQRNDRGQKVIGDHGFPLVDDQVKVIADPNPDCLIGFSNHFSSRAWSWGFTIDGVIGGDLWNGTQSSLDYYGVSEHTARQRLVSDYIFDGVNMDGSINNTLVDFAPKEGSVEENRWVRYGKGGVAEDYIQDASRLVLKELYLKYDFNKRMIASWGLEKLSVSAYANNLVTISAYDGNLGSNTLWGHHNTMGLDYFNTPQIRRYGLKLKLTF